jgi:hypothetical protein
MASSNAQSPKKKTSDSIWKVIFNVLLVINLLLGGYVGIMFMISALPLPNSYGYGGPGLLGVVYAGYFLLILAPVDLVVILYYIQPRGILRILTFAALVLISLLLIMYFVFIAIVHGT